MTRSRLRRPPPFRSNEHFQSCEQLSDLAVVELLLEGQPVQVVGSFRRGLDILNQLELKMSPPRPSAPFKERSQFQKTFRQVARLLWIQIEQLTPTISGSDVATILPMLYSESTFKLSFVHLQELAGAQQRFASGIHYPVLGHRLHPFYDVYAPSRTEHLELFATWLSQYTGDRSSAVDVGTGSGILALMMSKAGIPYITATDQNPNAIYSVGLEIERHAPEAKIQLSCCDLMSGSTSSPLIVFNPPWIPGDSVSSVDEALFFNGGLFERFFDQAQQKLSKNGTLVLIFSNILTLLRPDIPHPIESELQNGRFELVQKLRRKVKPQKGKRTKEKVEVWELRRKQSSLLT